ncbi:MAG: hypothetical protein ABJF23_24925 [Bryobacteraceae bacterium]
MRILFAAFLLAWPASPEILDRIAVTIGSKVITESELEQQIRLIAVQNGQPPDLSKTNMRLVAGKMVEQILIRNEIEANRYMSLESSNPEPLMEGIRKRYPDMASYQKTLAEYGITEEELKKQLQWQMTLLAFVDVRFRPGVQVPEAEVREYYEKQFLPEWTKTHTGTPPSFEESRAEIENLLTADLADHAMDRWLGQTRTQTQILFRREVFQ